jgi:hypothetical protein
MFPFPAVLGIIFFIIYMIFAAILGATAGLLTRLVLRQALLGSIWDALIGASGFAVGFLLCIIVPWPENTITYYVGETRVHSTMNAFQYPFRVAYTLAAILPVLCGFVRRVRLKPQKVVT